MVNVSQTSFSAGELSPTLYGRVDFNKYHIGLAKARNVFVDYRGGVSNRPGTRFVGYCSAGARLIPFSYSNVQNYILVFDNFSMRVIMNGGFVLEPAKAITGRASNVYTVVGHGYSTFDAVSFNGDVRTISVTVIDADHFSAVDEHNGSPVISAATTVSRIFTIVTPWAGSDVPLLKFTQSFDTMTVVHPNYPPYDITRSAHWVWAITAITFQSAVPAPTITSISITTSPAPAAGASTTDGYGYRVTAQIGDDESNPSGAITFQSYNISATPGTIYINWSAVLGAEKYNVYRTTITPGRAVDAGANYGYLGKSTTTTFQDGNIVPDFTKGPPSHTDPFAGSNYPGVVCYFEQRKVFAASNSQPQTIWMSQPGLYHNMDVSDPVNDGDALNLTIASTKANNIKSMQPMPGGLVVLTSEGAWQVSGSGQFSSVKVSDVQGRPQSHNGANDMPPIPINYEIMYVQEKGSIVRSMAYQVYSNTYQTTDLTIMSNHLFGPLNLKEWAYSEEPFKIIWCVREDGKMLTLTYMKDQEINGWTHQDTWGDFKSVATIQEGEADTVYVVVQRPVMTTIEQFQPRDFQNLEDGWFLDCALDRELFEPNSFLVFNDDGSTVSNVQANAGTFTATVGWDIRAAGGIGTITATSGGDAIATVAWRTPCTDLIYNGTTATVRTQISGAWSISNKITTVTGLDHLAGCSVMALADGQVYGPFFVVSNTITLPVPASKVIVGIPYSAQIQSLYLEAPGESIQGKRRRVFAMSARVHNSRGLKFGQLGEALSSFRITDENTGALPVARSGDQRTIINTTYNTGGQICVQQDNPWPMSVLMLIPELSVGEG